MRQVLSVAVAHGGCVYCDILAEEATGPRVVARSGGFVAFVPFAARFPYVFHLAPARHVSSLLELDGAGRLASTTVSEAENSKLQDRTTPAWRRVVDYWKATGLLWSMGARPAANECSTAAIDQWPGSAACRAFVVDTPWSAVFVSFAYVRAGVPGFAPSASHVDFVHQALRGGANGQKGHGNLRLRRGTSRF
jgi:hypothetical protein